MNFKLSLIAIAAIGFLLGGCNDNASDKSASRPAGTKVDANDIPVNTSPELDKAFDPAKNVVQAPAGPKTTMTFASYEHDFGTLEEGESATYMFEFTNTGTEPLILDKCKGSCGCTVPKCPREPIAPGGKGEIEVKFNSKGKKNAQTKKVTIDANTDPAQTFLTITAFVNPAVES
tara:strand:+ start:3212 stop:3736 length:525 start_codon:yes stop_codon:yes gene_type:complete